MQLPPHIIDLVGTLFDEGEDDWTICLAAIRLWNSTEHLRPIIHNPLDVNLHDCFASLGDLRKRAALMV